MANEILEGLKKNKRLAMVALAIIVAIVIFTAPRLNAKGTVFVDDNASGTMDGSEDHPFDKIQAAIDKASDKNRDVFVYNGNYKENLELWSDIELVGEDRGKVIIEGKKDEKPVVTMFDDSEIHNLVLREGRNGVRVKRGAKATISNCDIIDNEKDGIKARESKTRNDEKLEVFDSYIADNGENGIYTERKKVFIEGNLIEKNEKDGIELSRGSEGVIKKSRIKKNDGVGIKLFIDQTDVKVDSVTIRDNERDGIEVRSEEGANGFIHIEDCKFNENERWAIARIEVSPFANDAWNMSLLIEDPTFIESVLGNISPFINVF